MNINLLRVHTISFPVPTFNGFRCCDFHILFLLLFFPFLLNLLGLSCFNLLKQRLRQRFPHVLQALTL